MRLLDPAGTFVSKPLHRLGGGCVKRGKARTAVGDPALSRLERHRSALYVPITARRRLRKYDSRAESSRSTFFPCHERSSVFRGFSQASEGTVPPPDV